MPILLLSVLVFPEWSKGVSQVPIEVVSMKHVSRKFSWSLVYTKHLRIIDIGSCNEYMHDKRVSPSGQNVPSNIHSGTTPIMFPNLNMHTVSGPQCLSKKYI